jgi:ligand-binding sensor domain-containing protein
MHRIAAFLLLATAAYPQSRFQVYNTESGLPNNSVLAIRQTRDGYLWFTTYRGLVRFDEVRFQTFDPSNTPALRGTNFATFSLFEDHEGALWAGTWSSGVIRYQNGVFTAYAARDGLPNNSVVRVD